MVTSFTSSVRGAPRVKMLSMNADEQILGCNRTSALVSINNAEERLALLFEFELLFSVVLARTLYCRTQML